MVKKNWSSQEKLLLRNKEQIQDDGIPVLDIVIEVDGTPADHKVGDIMQISLIMG